MKAVLNTSSVGSVTRVPPQGPSGKGGLTGDPVASALVPPPRDPLPLRRGGGVLRTGNCRDGLTLTDIESEGAAQHHAINSSMGRFRSIVGGLHRSVPDGMTTFRNLMVNRNQLRASSPFSVSRLQLSRCIVCNSFAMVSLETGTQWSTRCPRRILWGCAPRS